FINFNSETLGIIGVTLRMSFASALIGSAAGTALGLFLEKKKFPGKRIVVRIFRTLMGTPPVVAGLVVYLLLMRRGPFGSWGLLFTVRAMVIAQVFIITPIITGMVYTSASRLAPAIRAFARTMGANSLQTQFLIVKEMSGEIYFAVITAFSRAISEVGAVMIVGGNIQHRTRTMTTAISMLRNTGDFAQGITLGIVLLVIAFILQSLSDLLHKDEIHEENF
ncbi:MAG: ABC transporter permease, partial [Treponema sp.]|nr:ABC transporter permease [Treponema sp.]